MINAFVLYHCRLCIVTEETSIDVASVGFKDSSDKTNNDVLKCIMSWG